MRALSPVTTKRIAVTLMLAGILPLSGCSRIKGAVSAIIHKFHHGSTAAASPTPAPVAPAAPVAANSAPAPAAAPVAVAPAAAPDMPAAPSAPVPQAINKTASVIVLLYHRFELTMPKNPAARDLVILPTEFDREMAGIKTAGFTVIPMQDFIAWRHGEKNIPAKSCIVTIDDGYLSGYDTAWPILKKYGYPFTMFVYIDYVGSGGKSLTWDQLNDLRDAGVDIESHTYSHSHLGRPGVGVDATTKARVMKDVQTLGMDGWIRKEVIDSKKVLEQNLGVKVDAFAYPYGTGSNDPHIRSIVKEANYDVAFNVYGRRNGFSYPPYDQIGRYAIGGDTAAKTFADAMNMVGGGDAGAPAQPQFAEMASTSMVTEPMDRSTTNNTMPTVRANLASMGDVLPASVKMRISGVGAVPATYDAKTKTVTYKFTKPLAKDTYTVILAATIGGQSAETRWSFSVDPNAKPSSGADMLSAPATTP